MKITGIRTFVVNVEQAVRAMTKQSFWPRGPIGMTAVSGRRLVSDRRDVPGPRGSELPA